MNIQKGNICRFCFKLPETDCEPLDNVMKMMLEVLLLQMNWNISKNSIMCRECAETTKAAFYFKSTCIYTELCILSFAIDEKETEIDVKNIFGNDEDPEAAGRENISACRLCMEQLERNDCVSIGSLRERFTFVEMLPMLMPELDLTIIKDPVVCLPCGEKIENYLKLVHNCLNTEEKMNEYCKDTRIPSINQEYVDDLPRNTEICEIKQEPDAFDENRNGYIKDEDKDIVLIHKDPSKQEMYKCKMCTYETRYKDDINKHIIVHKDPSKVEIYKCKMCTYETRYKRGIGKHMIVHKDSSMVEMYNCKMCTYESRHKDGINKHMMIHKDSSRVELYNCKMCTYRTRCRGVLKKHMPKHKHPSVVELELYKCAICNYVTRHKVNLNMHTLKHNASEVGIYECTMCSYETIHKGYFKRHALSHKSRNM